MLGELIGVALLEHNLGELSLLTIDGLVGKWEQFETKYNKSFKEYFSKAFEKYNKVRTILDSSKVEKLTQIFQPTSLYQDDDETKITKEIKHDEFLNFIENKKYVWITGHGGIGKSTLLKHTMLTILTDEKKSKNKIPVYIELRKYNHEEGNNQDIVNFIYNEMSCVGFNLEKDLFEYMLSMGRFLFLFDAYDEIISSKSLKFLQRLDNFLTKYNENQMVISSRFVPKGTLDNLLELNELKTHGLTKKEAVEMIDKIDLSDEELKIEFIKRLSYELFDEYESIASNPTLLLLMLSLFGENSNFPKEKSAFLIEAFTELFNRHDGRKLAYVRDFKSKDLHRNQMRSTFSAFCFLTYFDTNASQGEFDRQYIEKNLRKIIDSKPWLAKNSAISSESLLYDFRVCMCLLYEEGGKFYFVHNIFQEFFAAYYLFESSDKFKIQFLKRYVFNSSDRKKLGVRPNYRLFQTTFDYICELDESEDQSVIRYEFLLPLLKMIESEPSFTDYHHLLNGEKISYRIQFDNNKFSISLRRSIPSDSIRERVLLRLYSLYKHGKRIIFPVPQGGAPKKYPITRKEVEEILRIGNNTTLKTEKEIITDIINGEPSGWFDQEIDTLLSNETLSSIIRKTYSYLRDEELLTLSSVLEKEKKERECIEEMLL